jgi:hypothetical protein
MAAVVKLEATVDAEGEAIALKVLPFPSTLPRSLYSR